MNSVLYRKKDVRNRMTSIYEFVKAFRNAGFTEQQVDILIQYGEYIRNRMKIRKASIEL